jgi:hypothetical protein
MSSCIIRADTVIDALQACVSDAWWWCGLPGNSLKMGCCWVPSSAHPYCYKKNPNPPPPAPSDHDTQWPTDDGGKTVCFRHLCINAINLPRQARDKHRENSKTDRFLGSILRLPASGSITLIASNPLAWNRTTTLSFRVYSTTPGQKTHLLCHV